MEGKGEQEMVLDRELGFRRKKSWKSNKNLLNHSEAVGSSCRRDPETLLMASAAEDKVGTILA